MSEKRQRKQQRRARRKRSRSRPGAPDRSLAETVAASVAGVTDAFEAEQWASILLAGFRGQAVDLEFMAAFVRTLQRLGTAPARAALLAIAAVAPDDVATLAHDAADALADVPEPAWSADLGQWKPVAAALLVDPEFDDGVSVLVEFSEPGGGSHTLSVYIDYNLGGLVKDVMIADTLIEVRAAMVGAPDADVVEYRDLELGEARARIEHALDVLDHTLDPPVDEDVFALQDLIEARARKLPEGVDLPDPYVEIAQDERDTLLADFLAAGEGAIWRGYEDAEFIAQLTIDFGCDYNHGGPLRWSPVVVELFMLDWLGRKISEEPAFFERVPEVLVTWVRYAGRRRGVRPERVQDAAAAVDEYRAELLETVGDPATWGPAKVFANAAREAGVDLTDSEALERFTAEYNARK